MSVEILSVVAQLYESLHLKRLATDNVFSEYLC